MNVFLEMKVIIFIVKPNTINNIKAELIISDNVNYDINRSISLSELPFLVEK